MVDKLYIIRKSFNTKINWKKAREDYNKDHKTISNNKLAWDEFFEDNPYVSKLIDLRENAEFEGWLEDHPEAEGDIIDKLELFRSEYNKAFKEERGHNVRRIDWLTALERRDYYNYYVKGIDQEGNRISEDKTDRYTIKEWKDLLEFDDWVKLHIDDYKYNVLATSGTKGNNNVIFDTIWAVLTGHQAVDLMLTPGNFDTVKKIGYEMGVSITHPEMTWEEIDDIYDQKGVYGLKGLLSEDTNLTYINTHLSFHKQNMVAGKLIGVFAQNNVSHCAMSMMIPNSISDAPTLKIPKGINFTIELDNDSVQEIKEKMEITYDYYRGFDGHRISSILAELLAASVDAVKDPILNYMNINEATAGIVTTLLRMGYDLELVARFLTLPIIIESIRDFSIAKESNLDIYLSEIISNKLDQLIDNEDKSFDPKNIEAKIGIKYLKGLRGKRSDADDFNLLTIFSLLDTLSRATSAIITLTKFNSVSAAVGPAITDTIALENRLSKARNNPMLLTTNTELALNNPIIRAFLDTSLSLNDLIFRGLMVLGSEGFYGVLNLLTDMITGDISSHSNEKLLRKFQQYYLAWLLASDSNPIFNSMSNLNPMSNEHRYKLITTLPNKVRELQLEAELLKSNPESELANNKFLLKLEVKSADNNHSYEWVTLETKGMDESLKSEMAMYWQQLFNSHPDIAMELIEYNFLLSGLSWHPNGFTDLLNKGLKSKIPQYTSILSNTSGVIMDSNQFFKLFFRNNWFDRRLVPDLSDLKKSVTVLPNSDRILVNTDLAKKATYTGFLGSKPKLIVMYNDTLYELQGYTNGNALYRKTTKLGGKNNEILEINPEGISESILPESAYQNAEFEAVESQLENPYDYYTRNQNDEEANKIKMITSLLINNAEETSLSANLLKWRNNLNLSRSSRAQNPIAIKLNIKDNINSITNDIVIVDMVEQMNDMQLGKLLLAAINIINSDSSSLDKYTELNVQKTMDFVKLIEQIKKDNGLC